MPNHLSVLGIIHTAISIIAIFAAAAALLKDGRVRPKSPIGKWYVILTIVTCLTGLPIMRFGHPTPGHFLAIIILAVLPVAVYAKSIRLFKNRADYVQTILMSTTVFFSMVPAVNETLTRLPISHPLAEGPDSPLLKMSLLTLFVVYLGGTLYQVIRIRMFRKIHPDSLLN